MTRDARREQPFCCNIFLIGFMGSGKSALSHYLGKTFHMEILEMDQVIAEQEGMSISEIFKEHGEEYFRRLETELLTQIPKKSNLVISCGGGAPMRSRNVEEMKKRGRIILLTATPETIYQRVKNSHDRPILENNKTVSYIAQLMEQREEKYQRAADIIIETDRKTIEEICDELMQKLSEFEKE